MNKSSPSTAKSLCSHQLSSKPALMPSTEISGQPVLQFSAMASNLTNLTSIFSSVTSSGASISSPTTSNHQPHAPTALRTSTISTSGGVFKAPSPTSTGPTHSLKKSTPTLTPLALRPAVEAPVTSTSSLYAMSDTISFLEYLRAYQLFDILGKYKLF